MDTQGISSLVLPVHILGGVLALLAGYEQAPMFVVMLYWLFRIRVRKTLRGISVPEAA